jgi:Flp pilus assembly pilin Flp
MFQVPTGDRDERGQGLAEYALILGLLAVVSIAALVFIGTSISSMLSRISATL